MTSHSKIIVVVLVVVIVAGAVVTLVSKNLHHDLSTPPAPDAAGTIGDTTSQQVNVVTYTDTGFSPTALTVDSGTTVTFKNNSTKSLQVVGNGTTTYDGFGQTEAIANGDYYSFTFATKGSWGIKNSQNPTDTGIVTVQ